MKLAIFMIFFGGCCSLCAQGTFQNLDFESANLTPVPAGKYGGNVSISAALPGWTAEYGTTPITQVLQNNYTISTASVDILTPDWSDVGLGIIDGSYTVYLQPGSNPMGVGEYNTSIFQIGTVSTTAESLDLKEWTIGLPPSQDPTSSFTVSFNGTALTPILLSTGNSASGQPYNLYGFNIAPYAGKTGPLELTAFLDSSVEFDDISFSPNAVPEPSPFVLSGIAGLLLAAYLRLAPKRANLIPSYTKSRNSVAAVSGFYSLAPAPLSAIVSFSAEALAKGEATAEVGKRPGRSVPLCLCGEFPRSGAPSLVNQLKWPPPTVFWQSPHPPYSSSPPSLNIP